MSTPDTNNIGIKLQAAGENLNTWGDPNLNNDFIVVSHLSSGWNQITINGDYNVAANETNYATNNPSEYAMIKLVAGSVSANFNFIFPARAKRILIWNTTGFAAQMKLAATTGFSFPSGFMSWVGTDGISDVYNVSSSLIAGPLTIGGALTMNGKISGVSNPTLTTDGANKIYVDTAIATAGLPATAGTVLNSGSDTTAGYLSQKVIGSGAVSISTSNPGGNEKLNIAVGYLGLVLQTAQTAGFTAVAGNLYPCNFSTSQNVTMPASAVQGDTIGFDMYGAALATWLLNGLKYYGLSANPASATKGVQIFRYTNATTGWIDV